MANSYVQYTGTGAQTAYSVNFPYISQSHVKVFVDNVLVTNYTWTNASQITFSSAPSNGTSIVIRRMTPSAPLVDFTAKSRWQTSDLNLSTKQSLYLAEEAEEWATTWLTGSGVPSASLGVVNDMYFNIVDGGLWCKSGDTWQYLRSLVGPSGQSYKIKGVLNTTGELPSSGNTLGDSYIISSNLWYWSGSSWANLGATSNLQGPQGPQGPVGPTGPAASTIPWSGITDYGPTTGFWSDQSPVPRIWRTGDRLFIGKASTSSTGNKLNTGGTFLTSQMGAFWLERGATTLSVSDYGEFGGVFAARTSDKSKSGYYGTATIGIAAVVHNDDSSANTTTAWAGYFEATQGGSGKSVYGLEISLKNKGGNIAPTPYSVNGWGTIGIWMPAGGDASYNGVNANPNAAAIMIGRGDDQGNTSLPMSWNRGIVFNANGITGTDGTTGTGIAIDMAKGHVIRWTTPTGQNGVNLYSTVSDTTKSLSLVFAENQYQFLAGGGAGFALLLTANTGTANQVRIVSEAAGTAPQIMAGGTDTNIDLKLVPKGTGNVSFGSHTASGDVAVTGYITIKDISGTTRKLAVIA